MTEPSDARKEMRRLRFTLADYPELRALGSVGGFPSYSAATRAGLIDVPVSWQGARQRRSKFPRIRPAHAPKLMYVPIWWSYSSVWIPPDQRFHLILRVLHAPCTDWEEEYARCFKSSLELYRKYSVVEKAA